MKSFDLKPYLPHLYAVLIMLGVVLAYCAPVMQGKEIVQSDIVKNRAQANETQEFREEHGEDPLWTSRVFSGMTTFNISTHFNRNITDVFAKVINIVPAGANIIFATILAYYILLISLGLSPWLALIGAIGYGLSSNLLSSLAAGHNTKILSIAYMAPALGALAVAFRGRTFLGAILTMIFVGLLIHGNHFQIIYYFLLSAVIVGITYFIQALKNKTLPAFIKTTLILAAAAAIGFMPNFSKVYNVYAHSKETIRGGKKLLATQDKSSEGGLDKDYAMSWSFEPMETFSLVVPSFYGGSSQEALPENGAVAKMVGKQPKGNPLMGPTYIGDQPFLQGTVYFGAMFIFLFLLALFLVKDSLKIWVIAITVLSLFISWGRHFDVFTGFMFEYFPLYNKFRTPSMALAIAGMAIPLLGMYGLHLLVARRVAEDDFKKAFKMGLYVSGGLMLLLLLYGLTNDWVGSKDVSLTQRKPWNNTQLYQALLDDRKSLYLRDWMFSTAVMAITALMVWMYQRGKVKMTAFIAILAVATIADQWRVSKRYLNDDNFVNKTDFAAQFAPTEADRLLLSDEDPHFRVLNVTRNPWTDGMTCYHHENIGGHHAAKLQRYQDMIENQFATQLPLINEAVMKSSRGLMMNPEVSRQMTAFNMLNTKYYIVDNSAQGVVQNTTAYGNAWFVRDIHKVTSHDAEMAAISEVNPLFTAIIHEEFAGDLYDYSFGVSGDAMAQLTAFQPNKLTYATQNKEDGLLVFSEVYYTNGWKAFIDGEETPIYRANYILRTIKVPAGSHTIEMRFEPASYALGEQVSTAGSLLFVLFAGGMIYFMRRRLKESTVESH